MKILLVTNYQPPHMGGIEFAAQSLKACWERDGHQVTWLTTDIPAGGRPSTADNVRVPAANFFEQRFQVNSPLVYPWALPRILREIDRHDVVNIHSVAPGLSNAVLQLAICKRRPFVVTQHVAVIPLRSRLLSRYQHHFVVKMARKTIANRGLLTFVGQAVRDWFVKEGGLDEASIFMTPAGIDQATYHFVDEPERSALREKWKTKGNAFSVLFVGRFYDKKGLPLIREIAARNPDIAFTMVGGGPIDPASWNLPNLRIISFVSNEELRELYGSHDLFLMPSYGEGWPAVVPQAMACGLPCLVSRECFSGYALNHAMFMLAERTLDGMNTEIAKFRAGAYPALLDRKQLSSFACTTWDWQRTARIYAGLFDQVRKV